MTDPKPMTMREAQAFNDGKLAFRTHGQMSRCTRRPGSPMRLAWMKGFEEERARARQEKATPEEIAEGARVIAKLKQAWEETL